MKRVFLYACIMALVLSSCEADPHIMNPDAEPTLFVYGCLDMNSGKHQVKVRQAIQVDGDVREYANDPDYILPDEPIRVSLIINEGILSDTLDFIPVIYPKEDGVFSSEQNIIHELDYPIIPGTKCRLLIEELISGKKCTAGAPAIAPPVFSFPNNSQNWYIQEYWFTKIGEPFHVTIPTTAGVYKLITEIKYIDILTNGDTVYQKASFIGNLYFPMGNSDYTKLFELKYIYNILNQTIPDNPDVNYRQFYRFHFKSWMGSGALSRYLHYGHRFTDNRKLRFSNITGGYGLFYSCNLGETDDIAPLWHFTDSLSKSPLTSHLKFVKWRYDGAYIDPDTANIIPFN
ncbi:MAG: hypothetical protein J7L96_00895 [Bacteroidales bacterium]|nr:hypothetical protein [Bacteroidales bacterium]